MTTRVIGSPASISPITRVVIAHRPILVERADVVFRLQDCGLVRVTSEREKVRV